MTDFVEKFIAEIDNAATMPIELWQTEPDKLVLRVYKEGDVDLALIIAWLQSDKALNLLGKKFILTQSRERLG